MLKMALRENAVFKNNKKHYMDISEDVNVRFCYQNYFSVRYTYL